MTSHSDTRPDDDLALRIVRLESQLLAAQQENARLREALEEFVDACDFNTIVADPHKRSEGQAIYRKARAALRGGEGGHG